MKHYRRTHTYLVTIVVGGLFMSTSLWGQPPRDGNHPPAPPDSTRIAQMVEELATTLSLTAEQKEAVSALHFEHYAEARAVMESHQGDRDNHRQTMDALRKDLYEQVAALLTDPQKSKYEELVKDHGHRRSQQQPRRP